MNEPALEAIILEKDASQTIAKAVSTRHSIARKYVKMLRRRHPDASPAELIRMLEKHYLTSLTTTGAAVTVGTIAINVGIALIPVGGAASSVGAKAAGKAVVKGAALRAGKVGAQRAATLLPAGDEQLQFEITTIFGLAVAEIHGMNLDVDQGLALVYGLTNGRVTQQVIAKMANDLAHATGGNSSIASRIASGRQDWSHWATTLSETLPHGAAKSLVKTMQTGQLDAVRATLRGKQQSAVEYGIGAVAGGASRFVFGREVIRASQVAFPAAPTQFPAHLVPAPKEIRAKTLKVRIPRLPRRGGI